MKKLLTLMMLLVAIVTGAKADTEWVMANWSTSHTGLTYWASGASADIPSTSTDKNVPAWADESTYDTYTGTGGSSSFQLDSKTSTWKSGSPNRVWSFDVNANDAIKVYFCGGGTGNRSMYLSYNASTTNRDTETAFASATADGYTPTILTGTATTAGTVYLWCDQNVRVYAIKVKSGATEAFTVSFNAGTNGTCATTSITEESAGAGVTLPDVTANTGYVFDGWYDGETKVGDAGITYHPSAAVTLTAKYSALTAPSISVNNTSVSTYKSVAVTFTATADGAPDPTVTWYQNESASTTGGTSVGTGLTYQPDVTAEGTYYYYAVASNGVEPDATSDVVTLTVTDPDKYVTGNAYYISEDEVAVAGEKIYGTDITATIVNYSGAAPTADTFLSGINPNYVAQITGSNNGWGPEFVATKNGTLSVGVIINGGKTFTLTNVSSFDYEGVQDEGSNETSESAGTIESNTWSPTKKQWVVLTFDVVAGTTYKLSVAGSKMGFYGFEFTPFAAQDITVGTTGFATVGLPFATTVPEGVTAYAVESVAGSKVKMSAAIEAGTTIPANKGFVIVAAPNTYTFTEVATAEYEGIDLLEATGATAKTATTTEPIYVLYITDATNKKIGFKKATTGSLGAYKAYLPGTVSTLTSLSASFDDDPTAVDAIAEANEADAEAPVKVIKNGKLFIGNYNVAGARVK